MMKMKRLMRRNLNPARMLLNLVVMTTPMKKIRMR